MTDSKDLLYPVDAQFRLANAWRLKGRLELAIAGYQEILRVDPGYLPAVLKLGDLLEARGNLSEAEAVFSRALALKPNEASLHKRFINVLVSRSGLKAAFDHYGLERVDSRTMNIGPQELLCCVTVRNESLRLPYFLSYYRRKGVTRFLVVDNDSTDETLACLVDQPDVHVWQSVYSYHAAYYGTVWIELLLRQYGRDRWCLIVDADELLYYPDCETTTIPQLCRQLTSQHKRAFKAILLEMYAAKPIKDTRYSPGEDFLAVCPYFDRQFFHSQYERYTLEGRQTVYIGGARERVFGKSGDYYLSKVPLVKYDVDCVLSPHWTNLPEAAIAMESGSLLHFKYFASFPACVTEEVDRKEHYGHLFQYEAYVRELARNDTLTLYDEQQSIKFQNSRQLLQLGIMKGSSNEPDGA